jgi:uncharacterized protein (TIGR02996 family)
MDGLLERVLAAPHDAALREVWADALTEQGDPRGELIALQVAARGHALTVAQDRRARTLLAKHAIAWLGPLAGVLMHKKGLVFDRGLLKSAQVQVKSVPAFEAAIGHPSWSALERLWFCDRFAWDARSVALLTHPVMGSLREVTCVGVETVLPGLMALERPLPWTSLVALHDEYRVEALTHPLTRTDFAAALPDLAKLTLAGATPAMAALAFPIAQRLEVLGVTPSAPIDDEVLDRAARLKRLKVFEVRPHFFAIQGESRAHLVLRFTRAADGRFSRLELAVQGFRGPVAPRLDLPLARSHGWSSAHDRLGDPGHALDELSPRAVTAIELAVPRPAAADRALARFTHATRAVREP